VGPVGGSPVCCFPPCGVSPRGVWGLCPLRSSDDAFSIVMSPHPEPTSSSGCSCSEPDSGWQSAAARSGTTLSVPAPGRPPGHRHGYSSVSQIRTYEYDTDRYVVVHSSSSMVCKLLGLSSIRRGNAYVYVYVSHVHVSILCYQIPKPNQRVYYDIPPPPPQKNPTPFY